jgi:hypothetical protein
MQTLFAQSCLGNYLVDATGYYGGFETGSQSIGAGRGLTDLSVGSFHGGYQVVSDLNKPWESLDGGGYLPLSSHSGNQMMLIHTSDDRLWYKPMAVVPGLSYSFCAWIASAKSKPATGFEVRLRVKYGSTTTVIATSVAQKGKWSEICGTFTVPDGVTSIEFQLIDPFPNTNISNFLFLDDICIRNVLQINPDINATYVNVPVDGNVATNDKVPAGSSYGTPIAVAGNPNGATIAINSDGSYAFNAPTAPGVYQYHVPMCAPLQTDNCPVALLTITVLTKTSISNTPVANTDIAETKAKTGVVLNSLANDAAGYVGGALNPASVTIIMQPKNGTATVNTATGNISYVPANNFSGNDTLRYQVCDETSPAPLCATAIQIITVKASAAANTTAAADDYVATNMNTSVSGNVKLNDIDPEGHTQTVTAQSTTIAGKGTLVLSTDGSFTFTPAFNYAGPVFFVYTTCDDGSSQACASATLYILVQSFSSMTQLPVQLISFTGKNESSSVRLQWETAQESNSSHFTVEHSANGTDWKKAGTVKAAGTSSTVKAYSFVHTNASNGNNYYRLQQIDINGSSVASKVITVKTGGNNVLTASAYPNPFAGQIQLTVRTEATANVTVQLFDINGTLVQQSVKLAPAGESVVTLGYLENLPAGTYILKAAVGSETMTQKLFKQ